MKNSFLILLLFISSIVYSQNIFKLLDLPKGYPWWGQTINNDNGNSYDRCDPSYNTLTPSTIISTNCNHSPLGCGAVAMGQIMYYWEWPLNYNWGNIPFQLLHTTPPSEYSEIQSLLYDCATAMDMKFHDDYSYAYTDDVLDAFHNMGYEAATIYKKSDWSNSAWEQLIRTELDAGRPVFIRGGRPILDWWDIHYFVIDGYDRNNPNKFHFNFGWLNSAYSDANHTFAINNIVLPLEDGDSDFSHNQQIIIGISPTCGASYPHNITSIPYSQVLSNKSETAFNNISLPQNQAILQVENGGNYTLTAGNSITLNPGFKVKLGAFFKARIRNINGCDCGGNMSVSTWEYNLFTPFCSPGTNDYLTVPISNANSYTIQVYDREGYLIHQGSGAVTSSLARVWNGEGLYNCSYFNPYGDDYVENTNLVIVRFFNNCGQKIEHSYLVTAVFPRNLNKTNILVSKIENNEIIKPKLYPNPTNGIINFDLPQLNKEFKVKITSIIGSKVFYKKINNNKIDISDFPSGIYIITLQLNSNIYKYKIIKK